MDNRKLQVIDMLGLNVIEKHPRLCIVKKEESDFYEDRKIVFLQKYERQFDTFCDMDDNRYKFAQLIFSVRELDETASRTPPVIQNQIPTPRLSTVTTLIAIVVSQILKTAPIFNLSSL